MDKRFALFAALGLAAGIGLAHVCFGHVTRWIVPGTAALVLLSALLALRKFRVAAIAGVSVLFCLTGALLYHLNAPDLPTLPPHHQITGRIYSARYGEGSAQYLLEDIVIAGEDGVPIALPGRSIVTATGRDALPGQVLRVEGTLFVPEGPRNPGGFNQRLYLFTQGARYIAYGERARVTGWPTGLQASATAMRLAFEERIEALWPRREDAALIRGMLLGDSSLLEDEVREDFQRLGIAHVLAVSGLHMGFIYLMLEGVLRLLYLLVPAKYAHWWVRLRAARYAFTMLGLTAYAGMLGFTPSSTRALVLLGWAGAIRLWKARADPLTSLSVAALVLLLLRPMDLFSMSFQLSFAAVAGITLFSRPIQRRLEGWRMPRSIAAALSVSLAAQLPLLPLLAASFGRVPLLGILANLFAVPLAAFLVMVALPSALLSFVSLGLAAVPAHIAALGARLLLSLTGAAAQVPLADVGVPAPPLPLTLLFWLLLCHVSPMGFSLMPKRAWRGIAAVGGACFVALTAAWTTEVFPARPVVTMLDAGQGHATIARRGSDAVLVDGGPSEAALDAALYYNVVYDAAFLTHGDTDHSWVMEELIEKGKVKTLYVAAYGTKFKEQMQVITDAAQEAGVPVVGVAAGDVVEIGAFTARVLAPAAEEGAGDNANMVVLALECAGQNIALFPGDLAVEGEAEIDFPPSRLLQVAHHGSKYSTGEKMLGQARPQLALIPVGRNSYGHPAPETLRRLAEHDVPVERTDISGAVEVAVGDRLTIRRWGRER